MVKLILTLSVLFSSVIRLIFILNGKHVGDIYLLYNMGVVLYNGENPYLKLDFNSYPPLGIFLQTLSIQLSSFLHIPFMMVSKFFPNLADFLTAILIYKYLTRSKTKPIFASFWTGLFLLNPISIIVSSAHGQIDSITNFFIVLSIYLMGNNAKSIIFSALSLGMAIAIKPNPIVLIPFFLFAVSQNLKQAYKYIALIFLPLLISLLPFLFDKPIFVLNKILTYSGVYDMSLAAVLRGFYYESTNSLNLPFVIEYLNIGKVVFISFYIFVLFLLFKTKEFIKASLVTYLAFLVIYFGISVQYLVWVIPLAILIKDKLVIFYLIFATSAALGFYLFFGPNILLGKLSNLEPFKSYFLLYFFGNLAFWLFNILWLGKIVFWPRKNL